MPVPAESVEMWGDINPIKTKSIYQHDPVRQDGFVIGCQLCVFGQLAGHGQTQAMIAIVIFEGN